MTALLGHAGRGAIRALAAFLRISTLILDTLHWTFVAPLRHKGLRVRATIEQFVISGFDALPIITLICLLLGAILAMQSAYQLHNFGVDYLVPDLVAIAAMRELSPLMAAILVTGRSGSSFTAEIGTMKVSEEIDALDVMGLNPTKYLVVPKFIGTMLALPMSVQGLIADVQVLLGVSDGQGGRTLDMAQAHTIADIFAQLDGVRIFLVNQALQRPEIMIRTSPTQVEYYAIDRWASGLEEQIAGKINTEFASASSDLQPFNITATLMAFEQVDTPAGPEVLVKLDANIQPSFDATGQEPIYLRKLYVVTRPAAAPGAAAAVEALSRATEAIASEMAADIAAVVAQPRKN